MFDPNVNLCILLDYVGRAYVTAQTLVYISLLWVIINDLSQFPGGINKPAVLITCSLIRVSDENLS